MNPYTAETKHTEQSEVYKVTLICPQKSIDTWIWVDEVVNLGNFGDHGDDIQAIAQEAFIFNALTGECERSLTDEELDEVNDQLDEAFWEICYNNYVQG